MVEVVAATTSCCPLTRYPDTATKKGVKLDEFTESVHLALRQFLSIPVNIVCHQLCFWFKFDKDETSLFFLYEIRIGLPLLMGTRSFMI